MKTEDKEIKEELPTEEKEVKKEKRKKKDKVKELEIKIEQLEKDLLVSKADMINYRKRKEDEVSRLLKFCNEDLIKDLLPIIDNFERAINLSEDNNDANFAKLNEGYKMVYAGLEKYLS